MSTASKKRVVELTAPKAENLSRQQSDFLAALCGRLKDEGLELAGDSPPGDGVAARWEKMRAVDGIIVVAFSQWSARRLSRQPDRACIFPSEFTHIMNAMAIAADKPLLVIMEKDVTTRGTLRDGYVPRPIKLPRALRPDWLRTSEFQADFSKWLNDVNKHRHIFLGYCTEAEPVAKAITVYLTGMGIDVLDWHQFGASGFILQRIEEAAKSTSFGIFLFTASDRLTRTAGSRKVPRDNVIFELGYFAGQKGKQRTLVIVQDGTEVPTDLEGYLHVKLPRNRDISSIETQLAKFVEENILAR